MTIDQVLYMIAYMYKERHGHGIAKTRLLKLAYLAEVFSKRLTDERLTEAPWLFWHYGPYLMEYPKILESPVFIVNTDQEYDSISPVDGWDMPKLRNDEEIAISRAMKLADEDFNELLDFVYFDTEPMINVKRRGDILDFDCVKPDTAYAVKQYTISPEARKEIRKKLDAVRIRR